jgi:hypothetical protein
LLHLVKLCRESRRRFVSFRRWCDSVLQTTLSLPSPSLSLPRVASLSTLSTPVSTKISPTCSSKTIVYGFPVNLSLPCFKTTKTHISICLLVRPSVLCSFFFSSSLIVRLS